VLVAEVADGSEAWKAGIRPGMFISHVGGKRVTTPAEFQAATRSAGEKFDVRLTQPAGDAGNQPQPPLPKEVRPEPAPERSR
jgi:S1-C subfamily serine protease